MLTVDTHCAGHHCPSELWTLQFPAVCHYWLFGASVSNSVVHNVMSCHSVIKNDGQNSFLCTILTVLFTTRNLSDSIHHLSALAVMLCQKFGATWVISKFINYFEVQWCSHVFLTPQPSNHNGHPWRKTLNLRRWKTLLNNQVAQ